MKFRIEHHPNKNILTIHLNHRLIRGERLCLGSFLGSTPLDIEGEEVAREAMDKTALANFYKFVAELDGMDQYVTFKRYEIRLEKAEMFSWDDILPRIYWALQELFAKDGVLEEEGPPIIPTEKRLQSLRQQGANV